MQNTDLAKLYAEIQNFDENRCVTKRDNEKLCKIGMFL
jgi:hypothetical protein